jgi:hypothetical protein
MCMGTCIHMSRPSGWAGKLTSGAQAREEGAASVYSTLVQNSTK